mgnify:CR=1 FL=1
MFRLRLYCPFGGHGHNIFLLGVVLVSLSVMTAVSNNWNIFASIIIPTIVFIAIAGNTEVANNNINGPGNPTNKYADPKNIIPLINVTATNTVIFLIILFR